ncbi:DNA methyltransferase [uncultured Arthrobacter sp.]|uniref:class I SAM-dependent DNA methyltransferase n=1 Tax=uncultured Arthrobacter sp. TaxID=114050 RepID=UPI00262096AC|nr:DNA methyltransferase [uncultured Arthrobacter sp.]
MRSGEEIRAALVQFSARWSTYLGSEKAEAQTFLNELFECYGSNRQTAGAKFEDFKSSAGFMDLHWPATLIVEMKKPGIAVQSAREQVQKYWLESADDDAGVPAARWVVISNFHEFEIWEPGRFPAKPRLKLALAELPDKYDSLLFLADTSVEPVFAEHHRQLTREAAQHVASLFTSLADRSAAPIDEIQRFVLQSIWCLFAEDLGMIEGYPLQKIVKGLIAAPGRNSAAELGYLFNVLNQKGNHNRTGDLAGTRYVNGDLFAKPASVSLNRDELVMLDNAAQFDWRKVDPTIFGSLLEGVLGEERRSELGAHYTHEADIMKIVTPTIIRPWRERIEAVATPSEGVELLDELCAFKVLDPACGCGNFLYVAYRELRGLERALKDRITTTAQATGLPKPTGALPYYPLGNLYGLDIEGIAVLIARLTLWMGQRQMIDLYGPAENPLPLVDMSTVKRADALAVEWPEVDVIIGNPPFYGSQHLRSALGDEYLKWLEKRFRIGIKDLCVYWYRKAQDHLLPGQRAGLVGTNSVSQNRARSASLEYVVANGGVITDAVSSQKWPGDAKVHVSIVSWVKQPDEPVAGFNLDGEPVIGINPSLREEAAGGWEPKALHANKGKCFQGPIPVGAGFIISNDEAKALLASSEAGYRDVVRPYLTGDDITEDPAQGPRRWIIDFGVMPLEHASKYPGAFRIVRERVKPERDGNRDKGFREKWWLFGRARGEMRALLSVKCRWAAGVRVGKRTLFTWQEPWTCPSDLTNVFAFDDDYSMGVLTSRVHDAWAWHQSSTLETRLRYTPTSVFATFPWPDPVTAERREAVADLSRHIIARRQAICAAENFGLTKLYNLVDDGAYADLKKLHRQLDEAVAACYGWPKSVAQDSKAIVRRLTALNRQITEGSRPYAPFEQS